VGAAPALLYRPGRAVPPGSLEVGAATLGFPRNLGDLFVSSVTLPSAWVSRAGSAPGLGGRIRATGERNGGCAEVSSDEPNESGEKGEQESEGLVVPGKPANGPPRPEPVEGRGLPGQPTVAGKQGGYIETRSPVNAMATESNACGRKRRVTLANQCVRRVDRTSRMREFRTSGSVGPRGGPPGRPGKHALHRRLSRRVLSRFQRGRDNTGMRCMTRFLQKGPKSNSSWFPSQMEHKIGPDPRRHPGRFLNDLRQWLERYDPSRDARPREGLPWAARIPR
jgi:hypothetical protein